jgi:hypothetical protein
MGSGRIDNDRLDVALESPGQPARGRPVEVERRAVDPAATKPADAQDFEAFINAAEEGTATSLSGSHRQRVADFVRPRLSDPSVLRFPRSVSILEHLVADILPKLDDGEELRALAGAIIAEEIARHRDLLSRIHAGIAA